MSEDTISKGGRFRPARTQFVQPSQLLVGPSISTQLRNSSYGRFHEYLLQSGLQAELQHSFQLPRVIVVGGRSAGKSSLLESITKCPIFPRHRDFCTKMPIELHMKNIPTAVKRQVTISYPGRKTQHLQTADEILAEVNAIMRSVTGIDAKPIIIEICQADVPTFEFVDLPGIQTFPAKQEKATTDLVNSYLNKPDTLVLCVVDANIPAFEDSVALKLIRQADKLSNTIVALTKSDLVTEEEEYVPKIFDRLLGASSDNQHVRDLAGCVAVSNRPGRTQIPLAEVDTAERQVFDEMMQNPAPDFASAKVQRQLRENTTIRRLIVQLDSMYHSYIVKHWKPAAMKEIADLTAMTRGTLAALGCPVEQLTADGVYKSVLQQVNNDELCNAIKDRLWQQVAAAKSESCHFASAPALDPEPAFCARAAFVASASFEGVRAGYIFKKGPEGRGYYLDEKPTPVPVGDVSKPPQLLPFYRIFSEQNDLSSAPQSISGLPSGWGSMTWVGEVAVTRQYLKSLSLHLPADKNLLQPVISHVLGIFKPDDVLGLRLKRFSSLRDYVIGEVIPAFVAAVRAEMAPHFERLIDASLMPLWNQSQLTAHSVPSMQDVLEQAGSIFVGFALSYFMHAIQTETEQPSQLQLLDTFQLKEDPIVQQRREAYHDEIVRLETAHQHISRIEEAFNQPDSPSAAHAAAVNSPSARTF